MCDKWNSKKDAIRDIARISGLSGHNQGVVQDRPRTRKEQDTEMNELMSYYGLNEIPLQREDKSLKPDLERISNLINLVRDCNEMPSYSEPVRNIFDETPQNITITKMNPNAKEFVPKNTTTTSAPKLEDKKESEDKVSNDVEPDSKTDETTEINPLPPNENDIETVSKILKSKIKGFISEDTHKSKVEKNAVLASLLKLYTQPILLTPAYFETNRSSEPVEKKEKLLDKKEEPLETKQKLLVKKEKLLEKKEKPLVKKENLLSPVASSFRHQDDVELETPPAEVLDNSIRKVEQWLGGSTKMADDIETENALRAAQKEKSDPKVLSAQATPASIVSFENISYKRKNLNGVSSPSRTEESSSVSTPLAHKIYTPSRKAEALFEKFRKDKEMEVSRNETVWDKAQRCMREKEMKMRSGQTEPCL